MVPCCMEAFVCLWYQVLKMVVAGVNGYNQNHQCEWMLRSCGPFQAGKRMVTAFVTVVVTVSGFFVFVSEFHYIINGKRNHSNWQHLENLLLTLLPERSFLNGMIYCRATEFSAGVSLNIV